MTPESSQTSPSKAAPGQTLPALAGLRDDDQAALAEAVAILEGTSLPVRLAALVGGSVEAL